MRISMATNIPFEFFGEKEGLELLKKTGFDTVDYSLHIPGAYERLLPRNLRRLKRQGVQSEID